MFDKGAARAATRPLDQLLDSVFGSFADHLNAAVRDIPDPSCKAETLRLPLCAVTKVHALNYAVDHYMCPCFHCAKKKNLRIPKPRQRPSVNILLLVKVFCIILITTFP